MQTFYQSIIDYLKGSYQELGRVIWPSKKQTALLTLSVIGISLLVAIILGLFDALLNYLLGIILQLART